MARNLIILSSVLIVLVVEINVTLGQFMNGDLFGGVKDTFSSVLVGGKGLPLGLDKKARKGLETVGLGKAADMVGFRSEESEEDREDEEVEGFERANENDEETDESDFEEEEVEDRSQDEEEDEEEEEEESEVRKRGKGDKKGPLSSFTDRMGEMDDKISDTFGMRTGVGRFTELINDNGYEDENGANDAKNRKHSKSSHKGSKAESSASSIAESSASSKAGKGKSDKGKAEKWPTPSPPFFG